MAKIKKFLDDLMDKDNFDKSAGTAVRIAGSVFVANILSNLFLKYNLDEYGLVRHLLAGLVMGGVLYRATEDVPMIPRLIGISLVTAGINHGWEYFENNGHLYGTVRDSQMNSFSDLASVYLGSAMGIIKGWSDRRYIRKIEEQ
ncbi:MAG: hypothetical protein PHH00_01635 [Candidatus Nanoarchaeia archaeon]|nr:hypothetical protein [Candidatus Nanoarchaeia archaeon]